MIAKFSKNPIDTSYLNFKDIDGFSIKINEKIDDLGWDLGWEILDRKYLDENVVELKVKILNEKYFYIINPS